MSSKQGRPGLLIAAAFVGPGTVTVCTLAGAEYGYQLLWVLLISTGVTIFLQEMAARLGIVTKLDLTGLVKKELTHPTLKFVALALILGAIVIGNASYEAGNISGAALGLNALIGVDNAAAVIIGVIAFTILWFGNYQLIQKVLTALVILMSGSFVITAILTSPNLTDIISGLLIPRIPKGSLLMVLGLVGTTIVPYNLFLHASLVKDKWRASDLASLRKNAMLSIGLGGLVSMCIVICAGSIPSGTEVTGVSSLAQGLTLVYGNTAEYLLSIGLFAAGITSAITAPLAAAYVAAGCFGWRSDLKSLKMKSVWIVILAIGVIFSSLGYKPIDIIRFAQVANGLLLPIAAGFIAWLCAKTKLLGNYTNKPWQTILGIAIILLMATLGAKSIINAI